MVLRMKNFNILGDHCKIQLLREGKVHEKPISRREITRNLWSESVIGRWNANVFVWWIILPLVCILWLARLDNPAKNNDLEIVLWAFKNVQNFFGTTIKTFQLKNQYKPSRKSEIPFCCCCCWHYLPRIFSFSISF